jgi:hypothetical protein
VLSRLIITFTDGHGKEGEADGRSEARSEIGPEAGSEAGPSLTESGIHTEHSAYCLVAGPTDTINCMTEAKS